MNRLPNLGGYTPSDLQAMGMAHLLYPDPSALTPSDRSADSLSALECGGLTLISIPNNTAPINLNAEPRTLNPEPISPLTLTPLRALGGSVVKFRRRPRSKASQLPPDLQLSLNTMLANGCPYRDIILSLNAQGYTGFNKVNLHNWKLTGFQSWRSKTPEAIP